MEKDEDKLLSFTEELVATEGKLIENTSTTESEPEADHVHRAAEILKL